MVTLSLKKHMLSNGKIPIFFSSECWIVAFPLTNQFLVAWHTNWLCLVSVCEVSAKQNILVIREWCFMGRIFLLLCSKGKIS